MRYVFAVTMSTMIFMYIKIYFLTHEHAKRSCDFEHLASGVQKSLGENFGGFSFSSKNCTMENLSYFGTLFFFSPVI